MIARAPGKLVISGAYAVLEGAPAIVAAVDRYVTADESRPADLITDEVRAAITAGRIERAPWFDASPLRTVGPDGTSRKLGLGSSAAILVASIAACTGERFSNAAALRRGVFPLARSAHHAAQPGGSGIDVAASVFGGVLAARITGGELETQAHTLPEGTVIEVFASPVSASTARLLDRVRALADHDRPGYQRIIDAATRGASAAISARSVADFVQALAAQFDALGELGDAADSPIVTPEVATLRRSAKAEGAAFGPSGAGGGDIAIHVAAAPSSANFRVLAQAEGFDRLELVVGAPGVHRADPSDSRS